MAPKDTGNATAFDMPISEQIWDMKYRFKDNEGTPIDQTVDDTWRRIAKALAEAEPLEPRSPVAGMTPREFYEGKFFEALQDWKYVPAGRIVAGAGTGRMVTLFNCFVMGTIPDSMDGIFSMLREAALTMQQGGGIGYDFSTIRPKGALVKKLGADASGPLTFMDCWDSMCRTVMSAGSRRGAMMATMRCDHPDIEAFITAKHDPTKLRMFNVSVLATDKFMEAVKNNDSWDLIHPEPPKGAEDAPRAYDGHPGDKGAFKGFVYKTVRARDLWDLIMQNTYDQAEPGVIFIDRINKANNLNYVERIAATNPCGEQPLPPYGACLLGSINLARLVENPFTDQAGIDQYELRKLVGTAVRMMDNVVDVSNFPLEQQRDEAKAKRRIGLGVTGLADALIMVGLRYGSEEAAQRTEEWMKLIDHEAYAASVELAQEKGAFPLFDADKFLAPGTHASTLDQGLQDEIREHGIRNALLTSIAPTGTISLYSGNVSSGIEPVFALSYDRKVLLPDGSHMTETVMDYALAKYEEYWYDELAEFAPSPDNGREQPGETFDPKRHLPDYFVTAQDLSPMDHVRMQAAAQRHVDSSISKTVNVPEDIDFDDFKAVYMAAYDTGCKGCTTYRPNDVTGSILSVSEDKKEEPEAEAFLGDTDKAQIAALGAFTPEEVAQEQRDHDAAVRALTAPYGTLPERPDELDGTTYKIKVGDQAAVYLTVNDLVEYDGTVRPFEIFLRSSDPTHDEWMQALSRTVSAVLRRPHDNSFLADELRQVHSAHTGGFGKGGYKPSIISAIGEKLGDHMKQCELTICKEMPGVKTMEQAMREAMEAAPDWSVGETATVAPFSSNQGYMDRQTDPEGSALGKAVAVMKGEMCPKCHGYNMKNESGCPTCMDCGHSKCG